MRTLLLAAFLAGTVASTAQADVYDDKNVPIYLRTPDGLAIRPVATADAAGNDLGLDIAPTGSFPGKVAGESRWCGIYLKRVAAEDTQQWLNARLKDEATLVRVRTLMAEAMEVKSEKSFALDGDVAGMEYIGPMRGAPAAVVIMSLFNTPRGNLQLTCIVRATEADVVLPIVRSIRDSIRPPK